MQHGLLEIGCCVIAMVSMRSTSPLTRRASLLGTLALAGCVTRNALPGPVIEAPAEQSDAFIMPDGGRLPYRVWRPDGEVRAVVLALHGFNDSRDAWTFCAPDYAAAGMLIVAPDQRGFGQAPGRGLWPGTDALVDDADTMVRLLRMGMARNLPLFVMGESMGGAVAMVLATRRHPPVEGYVLSAPAVWGRARMNIVMQAGLWLASTLVPGFEVGRGPVTVHPSDNQAALIRLSRDPLTLHETRFDTLRGLVDLMDAALASAGSFTEQGLFQYGGHDELVPPQATAAMWRALPEGAVRAFYPGGYHLLPSDLGRAVVIADVVGWVLRGERPVVAEAAARIWLAAQG
jgi:alpha-beta hydrolase superfamily lysophospholipase